MVALYQRAQAAARADDQIAAGPSPVDADRAAPLRTGSATGRQQAGCGVEVDVCDQQSFLAVRLVAEHGPIRVDDRRRGWRAGTREVDGREIAGILGGAAQSRLLVK